MYAMGEGVPQDSFEAVKWFQKAADQGHVEAQTSVALSHILGEGVMRDKEIGCGKLRPLAEQGNRRAVNIYNKHCAN